MLLSNKNMFNKLLINKSKINILIIFFLIFIFTSIKSSASADYLCQPAEDGGYGTYCSDSGQPQYTVSDEGCAGGPCGDPFPPSSNTGGAIPPDSTKIYLSPGSINKNSNDDSKNNKIVSVQSLFDRCSEWLKSEFVSTTSFFSSK